MQKGTHILETKKSLNSGERELLSYLLEPLDQGISFTATSLQIDEMLKNTNLVKNKKWTHHNTCGMLSNLVGMDLVTESTGYSEEEAGDMVVNNQTPIYSIELNSVIHSRAVYARERPTTSGITLFDIIRGDEEYGEKLWPNRPTDRVKLEGKINDDGRLILAYPKGAFFDMSGQVVTVIIQS